MVIKSSTGAWTVVGINSYTPGNLLNIRYYSFFVENKLTSGWLASFDRLQFKWPQNQGVRVPCVD